MSGGGSSERAREAPPLVFDDIDLLRARAELMEAQLREFKARLARQSPQQRPVMKAVVDEAACCGCGGCLEVCAMEAISMADSVHIDSEKCVGCGVCLDACPCGALSLQPAKCDSVGR